MTTGKGGGIVIGKKKILMSLAAVIAGAVMLFAGCAGKTDGPKDEGTAPANGLAVYFFKTKEDSDAILLACPDANIMIDTGLLVEAPALMDSLEEKKIKHLDMLVLTHPDKDHIGGARSVLNTLEVDRLVLSRATKTSEDQALLNVAMDREGLTVDIPTENEVVEIGDLKITIFPTWQEDYEKTNDYSVAVLAEYAGRKFFFPGDAEKERITELLGEYSIGTVDVYKLPHHGRDGKKADKLLERLKPAYCVVTAAAPGKDTAGKLKDLGCEVFSTFDGEIRFFVDPETGDLKTEVGK